MENLIPKRIKDRLEYLRQEIINERISYGEIAELQSLAKYIDPEDNQLLEWAGVLERLMTREEYEKENEDDLIDNYLFDIHECTRENDADAIKQIKTFKEWVDVEYEGYANDNLLRSKKI